MAGSQDRDKQGRSVFTLLDKGQLRWGGGSFKEEAPQRLESLDYGRNWKREAETLWRPSEAASRTKTEGRGLSFSVLTLCAVPRFPLAKDRMAKDLLRREIERDAQVSVDIGHPARPSPGSRLTVGGT